MIINFLSDVYLLDPLRGHYSFQHPSWGDQTVLRSDTRGDRTGLSRRQHSGIYPVPAQVSSTSVFFFLNSG
jgi:hypothetical protein